MIANSYINFKIQYWQFLGDQSKRFRYVKPRSSSKCVKKIYFSLDRNSVYYTAYLVQSFALDEKKTMLKTSFNQ